MHIYINYSIHVSAWKSTVLHSVLGTVLFQSVVDIFLFTGFDHWNLSTVLRNPFFLVRMAITNKNKARVPGFGTEMFSGLSHYYSKIVHHLWKLQKRQLSVPHNGTNPK